MNWKVWIWALALAPHLGGCKASRGEDGATPEAVLQVSSRQVVHAGSSIVDDVRVRYRRERYESSADVHSVRVEIATGPDQCSSWEWSGRTDRGDKLLADIFTDRPLYRDQAGWSEAGPLKIQWDGRVALVDVPRTEGTPGPCLITSFNEDVDLDVSAIDAAKNEIVRSENKRLSNEFGSTALSAACIAGEIGSRTIAISPQASGLRQVMYVNHTDHRVAMVRLPFTVGDMTDMGQRNERGPLRYAPETSQTFAARATNDIAFRRTVIAALGEWAAANTTGSAEKLLRERNLCQ